MRGVFNGHVNADAVEFMRSIKRGSFRDGLN